MLTNPVDFGTHMRWRKLFVCLLNIFFLWSMLFLCSFFFDYTRHVALDDKVFVKLDEGVFAAQVVHPQDPLVREVVRTSLAIFLSYILLYPFSLFSRVSFFIFYRKLGDFSFLPWYYHNDFMFQKLQLGENNLETNKVAAIYGRNSSMYVGFMTKDLWYFLSFYRLIVILVGCVHLI